MIPILYEKNETEFKSNGLGLLKDTVSCIVTQERNSTYELELTYKVGSFLYDEIKCNRYIKAKANNRYEPQIFRIYYISKPINGKITVKAEHYYYELKDNFVEFVACKGDCQTALNAINSNAAFTTGFKFFSDIKSTANYNNELKSVCDCIFGSDGSILDTYGNGADIIFDNNNVSVVNEGGQDNNVLIAYKKNMTGFKCEENWTGCITRIYPYAMREDARVTISDKFVDSDYISRDKHPRIKPIDFSDKFTDDEEITEDKLRSYAQKYFKENKCDVPGLSYSIEAVALSKTEEYKNKHIADDLELFDYVIIRHELYGIDTKIKVLKIKYNTLLEKYEKIELNFTKSTITGAINNTNKKIKEVKEKAEKDTNNLKVIMEKRDSEIELSIENEAEQRKTELRVMDGKIEQKVDSKEFNSYKEQTDEEIKQGVKKGDFGSELMEHFDEIVATINDGTDHKATFNASGLHITNGGFYIENNNGDAVLSCDSNGNIRLNHCWASDLTLDEDSSKIASSFWNVLWNMETVTLHKLKIASGSTFMCDADQFYIDGQDLKEYIESQIYQYAKKQGWND